EEDGYLLALAFEGAARGEDLFCKMLRRVGAGFEHAQRTIRSLRARQRCAAFPAELEARRVLEAAPRASEADRRPALPAEAHPVGILKSTAGALHAGPQLFTKALRVAPSRPSSPPCRIPR